MQQIDLIIADQHIQLEQIIKEYDPTDLRISDDAELDAIEELLSRGNVEKKSVQQEIPVVETIKSTFTNEDIDQLLHQFTQQYAREESVEKPKTVPYIINYVDQMEKEPYLMNCEKTTDSDLMSQYQMLKQSVNTFIEIKKDRKQRELYEQINTKQSDFRIKCITCFGNIIALGTSKASIYILNNKIVKLESDPSIQVCPIVCLRFNEDGQMLVAISQQQIILYHKNKFCKAFSKMHDAIPISMAMCNAQKNFLLTFLSCDSAGKISLMKIRKNMLTYGIEKTPLMEGGFGVCHQCESATNKELQLAALAFRDAVFVIVVEPCIELLFKKPYEKKKRQLLCIKWQIESEQPMLAVGNGQSFEVIRMIWEIQGGRLCSKFEVFCTYTFQEDIQYLVWMSDNIVFVKQDRKQYSLLAISEILDENVLVIKSQMCCEIADQQIGDEKVQSVHNTICQNHNQMYFVQMQDGITLQQIIQYNLITWQEYIQQLISNHQWTECMAICLYLYKGKQLKFAGLPQKDREAFLRPHLQEKLKQFIEINLQHNSISIIIPTAIEFLVTIESYDFLFRDIRQVFKRYNLEQQFFNELEPFILKNCIKYIPDEVLKDVMLHFFNQRNKLNIIKQMIINLDIKLLDPIVVQQLCIENNLFTPLIYISPRVDDDYKTPLFKMYAVYRQLLKNDQSDIKKYFNSLQRDLPESQKIIHSEIKLLGYKCIWNLHMLLCGELFPQGKIDPSKWAEIVAEILSWLLQYDTLEEFYSIDAPVFLNEILHIFEESKYKQLEQYKQTITGDQVITHNFKLSQLFVILLETPARKLQIMDILAAFIFEIMLLDYEIKINHLLEVLKYCFKNPYNTLQQFVEKSNSLFQNVEYTGENNITLSYKTKRDDVLIKYIGFFKDDFNQEQLETILEQSSASIMSFVRIQAEVHNIQGDWMKCFGCLLASSYEDDKVYIFDYIEKLIQSQNEEIRKYVLSIVPQLVSICAEKLRHILQFYNEEDYKNAIEMLDSHPDLKLKLLSEIITEKRNQKQLVEDKVMISFFKLICIYHKDHVYEQLQHGDFPQDECLRLCQEHNILKGVAYLKERSGRYKEAINLYFDIASQELEKIAIINYDQQTLTEEVQIVIFPSLKICRENHSNEEESTSFWFTLILRMVKLREQFEQNKGMFKSLNQVYQLVLQELLERVHLQSIINNIKLLFSSFTHLEELRRTFSQLLSSCSFELYNQNQLNQVLQLDYLKNVTNLHELLQRGINFGTLCQTCDENRDQYMLGFVACHHIYHSGCAPKVQNVIVCDICFNEQSYKCTICLYVVKIQLESVVEKNQRFMPQIKYKQKTQEENETYTREEIKAIRINKWKMFDIENEFNECLY